MLYWLLKHVIVGPALRVVYRPVVQGKEHLPAHGPAILASNHLSFSDSIFLPLVVPRRITFLAKSDYFTGRGFKGRLTAAFFRGVGQVPIDRAGGSASRAALNAGLRILRSGELLGIYPEGTRSPDGRLYRGRTGAARMALKSGAPLIPVAMIGTDKAQPTGQIIPSIHRIEVRIGAPLDLTPYAGRGSEDREVLREITDALMARLQELSGQRYVDVDSAAHKRQLLAAARARLKDGQERLKEGQAKAAELGSRLAHRAHPDADGVEPLSMTQRASQPDPDAGDRPDLRHAG